MKNNFIHGGLALLLSLIVIFAQMAGHAPVTPYADSVAYLTVATHLHDTGYFTDGNYSAYAVTIGQHGEGMFFAPLYPAFLAAVMALDHRFLASAACVVQNPSTILEHCTLHLRTLVILQGILAACSAFLIWLSGFLITDKKSIAWVAWGLALFAVGSYAFYAGQIMTENLTFPLFTLGCLLGTLGLRRRRWDWCLAAGIVWGLLSLTRPSFPYVIYFMIGVAVLWSLWVLLTRKGTFDFPRLALVLVAGYALLVTPWVARNGVKLDSYAISKGYAPYILYQRVIFNEMTPREWATSFVFALPNINKTLLHKFFAPADYERLSYSAPNGFYQQGQTKLPRYRQMLAAAGGADRQMGYLLKNYILAHPLKHCLVTLSLAWRGMWVSKVWSLVMIPVFAAVLVYAVRAAWWDFVLFALPPWFMLGFNAFTSVNVVRYNLVLLPCLAIAGAWAVMWLYNAMRVRCSGLFKSSN